MEHRLATGPAAPGTVRLLAGAVVGGDPIGSVWRPGVVDLCGDRFGYVGGPAGAPAHSGPVRSLPGVLIPGLVNAHGHTPMTLLRGVGEGLSLEDWLLQAIWPREAHLTPEDVYWGMTLGAAELLRCGVTTTCETYFYDEALVDAVVDAGLRCLVTPGILDLRGAPGAGSWRAMLEAAGALHSAAHGRAGRVSVGVGPHAAYSLPEAGLVAAAGLARELGTILNLHLSETEAEDRGLRAAHGTTVARWLADIGVFDARSLVAHAVWLTDEDISVLAAHHVAVAHCPQSNAKLGSGIARLVDLLDCGVTVGLGTDGPASNNDLDLWEELRLAPLLARARSGDAGAVPAAVALALATAGGAAALGIPTGILAPGHLADLVHVRSDDARFVPVVDDADLLAHLVWSSASHLVSEVWIGGVQVVEAGRVLTVDVAEAARQVQARAERIAASVGER